MTSEKLLLIGGGGHCKSVLDSLLQSNQYSEIGIIDKKKNIGKLILDKYIIGCDDDLIKFHQQGYKYAFVTLGSVGDPSSRVNLFTMLEEICFEIPNIIDISSTVSNYINMETGIYIGKNAVVNAGTSIGKGAIINTSSTIEHDCEIAKFSHIAPGAVICGGVKIGENSHIGANSVVQQEVKIGANTIIGMGSVVLKNVDNYVLAYGNPCKEVRSK
ncbi:serine acetyltransferase [Acetobacterium paludosum]|uniref:Serine acetyltransferase n=1 Tax=Acetobacterium paludosum TaxID=52693 RepID=A0A923HTW6_9FIRM|nr:acetyltransferase [Acetobacterium paludosum]MBC3888241.1 serine acetyltransferase [Acetobacterium paludosum]